MHRCPIAFRVRQCWRLADHGLDGEPVDLVVDLGRLVVAQPTDKYSLAARCHDLRLPTVVSTAVHTCRLVVYDRTGAW
jgi:hypothetical protein